MNRTTPTPTAAPRPAHEPLRAAAREELEATLAQRDAEFERTPILRTVWDQTLPAALDPLVESGPFAEPMRGLATRELREPDLFRHLFARRSPSFA